MDDSERTFSSEPSSSAMRARAFAWVFTRSCQSTGVFAEAAIVFPLRAMLTAGITRETSPARCPAAWGAAQLSAGIAIRIESNSASPKADGDFVFIKDSPGFTTVSIVVTGGRHKCQRQTGRLLPTLYMLLWAHSADIPSTPKLKYCTAHLVISSPPAAKLFHSAKNPAH